MHWGNIFERKNLYRNIHDLSIDEYCSFPLSKRSFNLQFNFTLRLSFILFDEAFQYHPRFLRVSSTNVFLLSYYYVTIIFWFALCVLEISPNLLRCIDWLDFDWSLFVKFAIRGCCLPVRATCKCVFSRAIFYSNWIRKAVQKFSTVFDIIWTSKIYYLYVGMEKLNIFNIFQFLYGFISGLC